MENLKEIGNRLKLFRKEQNLSQQALASKCGVDQSTISKFEKGEVLSSGVIIKLPEINEDFSIDWLLSGKGSMYIGGGKSEVFSTTKKGDEEKENSFISFLKQQIIEKDKIIQHFLGNNQQNPTSQMTAR